MAVATGSPVTVVMLPFVVSMSLPATVRIDFGPVPAGRYAISLIHDENANRKLDLAVMVPKEGYGFSRDAPVTMGPPKFDKAAFDVAGATIEQKARMRYIF